MRLRVIKLLFVAFLTLILSSCVSRNLKFGNKTEFSDSPDSLVALKKIQAIKSLDYSDFKEGKFKNNNLELSYRFLSPKSIESNKKYPLILVFHGSGAIGINNTSQMGVLSKMWLTPENIEKYPAFVLSPQFPIRSSNYHLDETRNVKASESNEYLDLVLNNIDNLIKSNPHIDKDRIYVMGFSMGGATTMNAISKRPELFAAAINVSGISEFDKMNELKNLPLWIVHGSLDNDNSPKSNFRFFDEMKNQGKVFLWEYKDKYHNNILNADLVEAIPMWLLKQKK